MNILAIITIGIQFWTSKTGVVTAHIGGKTQTITVKEEGAAGPAHLGHLTFGGAIALAENLVTAIEEGGTVDKQVRVGADVYDVDVVSA